MKNALILSLCLISWEVHASDIEDHLALQCKEHATVLTQEAEALPFLEALDVDVRKVLVRRVLSPSEFAKEQERPASSNPFHANCINFYPIQSSVTDNLNIHEALFVHYSSDFVLSQNLSDTQKALKSIDQEEQAVFSKAKAFAERLSLNYLYLRPEFKVLGGEAGQQKVLGATAGKDYRYFKSADGTWLPDNK
jgi:hypothetical protein